MDRARKARRLSAPKTCLGPHHDPQQSPARKLSSPEMSVLVFFPTAAQDLGCARQSRLSYCSSLSGFQRTSAYNALNNTQSKQTASEQRPPQSPRRLSTADQREGSCAAAASVSGTPITPRSQVRRAHTPGKGRLEGFLFRRPCSRRAHNVPDARLPPAHHAQPNSASRQEATGPPRRIRAGGGRENKSAFSESRAKPRRRSHAQGREGPGGQPYHPPPWLLSRS